MTTANVVGRRAFFALALVGAAACGGKRSPPPQPGESFGFPPDLRGRRVVLLPVQHVLGVAGDPSAEMAFTFRDRAPDVDWVLEQEVEEVLARSPAIRARTRGLPVGVFLQAQVQQVGDPLYGELRRIAALVDATAIVLPVQASFEASAADTTSAPRVRFTTAVIEPRTGRVVWFGVEEGGAFPRGDPRGLASAVESLADVVLWYAPPREGGS